MVEKEDLCLSLSLNFPAAVERNRFCNSSSPQLNLLVSSSTCFNLLRPASNGNDCFPSSSDLEYVSAVRGETKSFMKGIDVNLMPELAMDVEEEVVGVSSPTSSVSSVSGNKRSGRRASPLGISDEDDGDTSRKKLRLSKDQSAVLEESFKQHHTLNPKQKHELAKRLGLRPRQVEVWFQNRRARRKLKQKEVEYELIKRCCENLTEENMKLQKELQELKTIKLSPQIPYHPHHERCPSCEIWADHEQRLR